MARDIKVSTSDWVTYIPNVDENRQDPNPLTVELHPMSAADVRAHQRALGSNKGSQNFMARSQQMWLEVFRTRVRNVQNYRFNGKDILTGEDLFNTEDAIVNDVYEALTNMSILSAGVLGK
jgi:hypothetical protein